jgi:hypothetical protein
MSYGHYLSSSHWKKKRSEVLNKKGNTCSICFKSGSIHIHHSKYRNFDKTSVLGREKIKILFPLCSSCHNKWHYYHNKKTMNSQTIKRANAMFLEGVSIDECIRFCYSSDLFKFILFEVRASRDGDTTHKYKSVKRTLDGSR